MAEPLPLPPPPGWRVFPAWPQGTSPHSRLRAGELPTGTLVSGAQEHAQYESLAGCGRPLGRAGDPAAGAAPAGPGCGAVPTRNPADGVSVCAQLGGGPSRHRWLKFPQFSGVTMRISRLRRPHPCTWSFLESKGRVQGHAFRVQRHPFPTLAAEGQLSRFLGAIPRK